MVRRKRHWRVLTTYFFMMLTYDRLFLRPALAPYIAHAAHAVHAAIALRSDSRYSLPLLAGYNTRGRHFVQDIDRKSTTVVSFQCLIFTCGFHGSFSCKNINMMIGFPTKMSTLRTE